MCPGVHIMTSWKAGDSIQLSRDSRSWWARGGCGEERNCFRSLVETKSIMNFLIFPLRDERVILPLFFASYVFIYLSSRQWVSHFVAQVGFKLKEILLFQPSQYRVIGVSHHTGFTLLCSTLFSNFPPLAGSLMFSYSCIVAILNCFQRIRFCFQLRVPGTIIWSKICY